MKRFILALIILLVPILSLVQVTSSNETASAGTLAGWDYRKAITINHTDDGNVSNYQMKLTLNKSVGNDSTGIIYLNNHALNWPTDIYFTKSDGTTGADFWRESNTSTQGVWWVEADTILNGSTWTGYMYYGDADAADESDGASTFKMFNDGSSVAGWTAVRNVAGSYTPTWAVNGNKIRATAPASGGYAGFLYCDTVVDQDNYRLHAHIQSSIGLTNYNYQQGLVHQDTQANTNTGTAYWLDLDGYDQWVVRDDGTDLELSAADVNFDARNDNEYILTVDDETHTLWVNGAEKVHIHEVGWTPNYIGLYLGSFEGAFTADFWNIFVANFTSVEPTWAASGAEEFLCAVYLTTSSGSGGNVSTPAEGTSSQSCNASVNISATADACYRFVNWTGNTTDIANTSAASTTIAMGTTNKTATANFVINTSTITYTAGTGGTINGTSPQTGNCGSNTTSVTAVANACYYFVNWSPSGTSATRNDTWTSTNQTFTANFALIAYGSPSLLSGYADDTRVNIAWSKGTNTSETVIRWKVGSYSVSIADGNIIANQSGYSYTHTGLLSGTSYYYTLWGKNGSCLSTGYSQILCSTTSGYTEPTPNPLPETDTSGWFGDTNASALVNNPLYPAINQMADGIGMPYKTWWMLLTIGFMVMAGIWVFVKSDNLLLAITISVAIGVIAAVKIFLIPVWIAIVMVIIAAGFGWKELR